MTPDRPISEKAVPRPNIPGRGPRPNIGNTGRPTAARWKTLRIEPYNPDARDADNDGIVQEGTIWERPAGTRIVWRANNSAVAQGLTGEKINPALVRVVDADGNDVDYIPTWQRAATGGIGEDRTLGEMEERARSVGPTLTPGAAIAAVPEVPRREESTPDWMDISRIDWDAVDERLPANSRSRSFEYVERERRLTEARLREALGERGAVRAEERRQNDEDRARRDREKEERERQAETDRELARTRRMRELGEGGGQPLLSASLPDRTRTADGSMRRSSSPPEDLIGSGVAPGDVDPEHWSLTARIDEALVAEDGSSFSVRGPKYDVAASGRFSVAIISKDPNGMIGVLDGKELLDTEEERESLVTLRPESPSGDLQILDARNPAHRDVLYDAIEKVVDEYDFGRNPFGDSYREMPEFEELNERLWQLLKDERTAENFTELMKSFLQMFDVGRNRTVRRWVYGDGEEGFPVQENVPAYSLNGLGPLSVTAGEILREDGFADALVDGFLFPNWTDPIRPDVMMIVRPETLETSGTGYYWTAPRRFDQYLPKFDPESVNARRSEDGRVELPYDPFFVGDEERFEVLSDAADAVKTRIIDRVEMALKAAYRELGSKLKRVGLSYEEIESDPRMQQLKQIVDADPYEYFEYFAGTPGALEYIMRHDPDLLPRIQIPSDLLISIFADGRFRTQFETGRSGGDFNPRKRQSIEDMLFGAPLNLDDRDRPVYGFLPRPTITGPRGPISDLVEQYGDATVVLRPEVRERTTWTLGDSFMETYPLPLGLNPNDHPEYFVGDTPLWLASTDPYLGYELSDTIVKELLLGAGVEELSLQYGIEMPEKALKDPRLGRNGYEEAQIHGGVTLADIAQLRVPIDPETGRIRGYSEEEDAYVRRLAEQYEIEIVDDAGIVLTGAELQERQRANRSDASQVELVVQELITSNRERIGIDIPPEKWDAEQRIASDFVDENGSTYVVALQTSRGGLAFASRDPKAAALYGTDVRQEQIDPQRLSVFDLRNPEHRQKIRRLLKSIANMPMVPGGDKMGFSIAQEELLAFLAEADTAENMTSAIRALDRLYNAATDSSDRDAPGAGVSRILADLRGEESIPDGNTVALAMADLRDPNNKDVLALAPPERTEVLLASREPRLSTAEALRPVRVVDLPYDPTEIIDNEFTKKRSVETEDTTAMLAFIDIRNDLAVLRERLFDAGVTEEEFTTNPKLRALFGKSDAEWQEEIRQRLRAGEFDEAFRDEFEDHDPDLLVQVRVPVDLLEKILEDGRIKSQFETGTSLGVYAPDERREVEAGQFGIPYDLSDGLRPIYGYIPSPGWEEEKTPGVLSLGEYADQYGEVVLVMRPEIKDRTTTTPNDSFAGDVGLPLGFDLDDHPELLERGPDSPPRLLAHMGGLADLVRTRIATTMIGEQLKSIVEEYEVGTRGYASMGVPRKRDRAYIEAQIHGGLSLEDVVQISILPNEGERYSRIEPELSDPLGEEERERLLGILRETGSKYGFDVVEIEELARTESELAERRRASAPLAMAERPERMENADAFDPVEELVNTLEKASGPDGGAGPVVAGGIFPKWGRRLRISVQDGSGGTGFSGVEVRDPITGIAARLSTEDLVEAIGVSDPQSHIEELLLRQGIVPDFEQSVQSTLADLNKSLLPGYKWRVAQLTNTWLIPEYGGKVGDTGFELVLTEHGRELPLVQRSAASVLRSVVPEPEFDPITRKPVGVIYPLNALEAEYKSAVADLIRITLDINADEIFDTEVSDSGDMTRYKAVSPGGELVIEFPVGEGLSGDTGVRRSSATVAFEFDDQAGEYVAVIASDVEDVDGNVLLDDVEVSVPVTGARVSDARELGRLIKQRLDAVLEDVHRERAEIYKGNKEFYDDRKRFAKLKSEVKILKGFISDKRIRVVAEAGREVSEEILNARLESGRYLDAGLAPQTKPDGVPGLSEVVDLTEMPEFEDLVNFMNEVHGVQLLESGGQAKVTYALGEDFGQPDNVGGLFRRDFFSIIDQVWKPGEIAVFFREEDEEYRHRRTMAHEMGHRVDAMPMDLQGRGFYMERTDDPLVREFLAVAMQCEDPEGMEKAQRDEPDYYDYYTDPKEFWARVYAAWVMSLAKEPAGMAGGITGLQHADVARYAPAFPSLQKILRARGLLK